MSMQQLKSEFDLTLNHLYPSTEISNFFYLLTSALFSLTKVDIALNRDFKPSSSQLKSFNEATERLKHFEPIQYIIGTTHFFGYDFKVDHNVLIPRPETEELVEWIIKNHPNNEHLTIVDIGTGSGCIAIALKKHFKSCNVYALDISKKALNIAELNARNNNTHIQFLEIDILNHQKSQAVFSQIAQNKTIDIIVSNPPYVRYQEQKDMQRNVLDHEPALALYVDNHKPLVFYDAICRIARQWLNKNGALYFEINEYLGLETKQLFQQYNFGDVELKKDFFGAHRMICGQKK